MVDNDRNELFPYDEVIVETLTQGASNIFENTVARPCLGVVALCPESKVKKVKTRRSSFVSQ